MSCSFGEIEPYKFLSTWSENIDEDYQFFWIWPAGRYADEEILSEIRREFDVLALVEVSWPQEYAARCFNRIYARNLHNSWSREMSAGSGDSLLVIVQDHKPNYDYVRSASGTVKFANIGCVRIKESLRALAGQDYGYAVHSSINRQEFLRDMLLVLGPVVLSKLLCDARAERRESRTVTGFRVVEPLIGHHGWESWNQLFSILELIEPFVVLSSKEDLNLCETSGDVDVLTENIWSFAAVANAELQQIGSSKPRFIIEVAGARRLLDLREPGDGDMPVVWQERLLMTPADDRLDGFLSSTERVPYRIYRVLCQKAADQSASRENELAQLLKEVSSPAQTPFAGAREFVAGYLIGSRCPILGVERGRLGSPHEWDAVTERYSQILGQAEPPWKYII